ncbi:hypothetical protein AA984_26130 [Brevibacillus formosus]|uniref:Uncharacterized protein n=1 Tax=Brevibacillus formosus TaxID=54913 RepID=A0A837KIW6_9BACL|nr:hypothetical protein AA984_26130 [Brevibacillus formosus]PSJ90959.1 hypothetical protein C7R91_25670 [Brevibacillus formosus]
MLCRPMSAFFVYNAIQLHLGSASIVKIFELHLIYPFYSINIWLENKNKPRKNRYAYLNFTRLINMTLIAKKNFILFTKSNVNLLTLMSTNNNQVMFSDNKVLE